MKKNVSTQEAHIRTLIGIILLLLALFLIDNAVIKILFATIAAILAGTAFLHSCPLYTLMDKSKQKIAPDTNTSETTPSTPMPEEPVVQTEEESTVTAPVEEETTEEKKV
ncbi:TPA: hypothetical protein DEP58_04255 [Patescibacteria group bacterium]|nr:MAG: hypothetical protein UU98_C0017G0020 [Parcubacteria group bacterium GW2011_GWD2_42_14]HCC05486.1 hypothetical protein [Patescibacteria group bacterium]